VWRGLGDPGNGPVLNRWRISCVLSEYPVLLQLALETVMSDEPAVSAPAWLLFALRATVPKLMVEGLNATCPAEGI